ncbi:Hypothetical predicted protein [Mytilus galloprovincialis]|uniref:Ig-like domain-containing protein n=1 Tax=Mytilus galloprovincialis TaxID=29158 RepID=A0A8B6FNH4_MYTGA|nr:Hypothetical predicted protein [Mytilus galloprovincialis]
MRFLQTISFSILLIEINAKVSLDIASNTNANSNDIVLTCTVHGIQIIDIKTTRLWSVGEDYMLLCINGRSKNPKKYREKVLQGNEFSLTIFNLTESDLHVVYQCNYGFEAASKLIEADNPKVFLSLGLVTENIIFGGYIILTCAVNGINTIDRDVARQWEIGNDNQLLSFDGDISNHRKYEETILPGNEFNLKILNVTQADVNVTYRCRYGFDTATYFIKISESASLPRRGPCYPSSNISCHYAEIQKDEWNWKLNATSSFKEKLETKTYIPLLATLIPLAVLVVAVAVICIVIAKRKHQRKGN